jgi:hypothetical protein
VHCGISAGGQEPAELGGHRGGAVSQRADIGTGEKQRPRRAGHDPVGTGREDPGHVLGGRSLRTDPRCQEQRLCAGQIKFGLHADRRDHGADRADLTGCQRVVQFPDLVDQPFIDLAAGVLKGGLDSPPFRIGGTGNYQQAASGLAGSRDEGPHRLQPEIGVNCDRVGFQRCARAEERLRVGIVGAADVAALHVQDDEQPGAAGVGDQPAQRPESPPAVALEEGRLRFHQSHRADRGAKHYVCETIQAIRIIA